MIIDIFKNALKEIGIDFDKEINQKENAPTKYKTNLTLISKKSLFKWKLLKWIKIRKKEDVEFKIKFYHPTYANMNMENPLMIVPFSKKLKIPAEVDFDNNILYVGEIYEEKLSKFLDEELENDK